MRFWLAPVFLFFLAIPLLAQTSEFRFCLNTNYPAYIAYYLMDVPLVKGQPSFLDKRCAETGGEVKIVKSRDYIASIEALGAGQYDGMSIALLDSLIFGIPGTALMVSSYSSGNDGLVVPKDWTIENMRGKTILGDRSSPMELMLERWLEVHGVPKDYVKLKDMPGEEDPTAFLAVLGTKDEVGCLTWNPNIARLEATGRAKMIFSSANTPAEMLDVLIVRSEALRPKEKSIQAFVNAYYDALGYYNSPETHEQAIAIWAKELGFAQNEIPMLKKMLEEYQTFFNTRSETREFLEGKQWRRVQGMADEFIVEHNLLKGQRPAPIPVDLDFLN